MRILELVIGLMLIALSVNALPNIDYTAQEFLAFDSAIISRQVLGYGYVNNYRVGDLIVFKYHMYQFRILRNGQTDPNLWTYRAKDVNSLAFLSADEWDRCRQAQTTIQCWAIYRDSVNDQIDGMVTATRNRVYLTQQFILNYNDLPGSP